ncbi:MAG: helix-turn-helix domain-containing protein [Deltaproteobacteria bacterium]|nr:helix-turn-helix domain-containing protein [Deltaproteobacteria bacterium]MBI3294292.1 helix-turn-helix domain-containing protein [Deltaproteobacteria bacterium]
MKKATDTFYDLLKVPRSANIGEIVAAYHTAKSAFSKDSVATYSLFSAEEVQIELGKLEEAYLTLSNIDKKRDYDKVLTLKGVPPNSPQTPTASPPPQVVAEKAEVAPDPTPPPATVAPDEISGPFLEQMRTQRGLSVDDVSRITKIPTKFLKAIEAEDVKRLPARVYVQGFVKNIAVLYKLDAATTATAYLNSIDSRTKELWKE